jgi:hypothetical protein
MKFYFSLTFSLFIFFAYSRQNPPPADLQKVQSDFTDLTSQVSLNNSLKRNKYDTVYNDFEKTFYVTKSEFKDKNKLDSLFGLSKYYLIDAIRNGYHRIIITVIKKGPFAKYRDRIFYCDKLYEELTGRKLYSIEFKE